MVIMLRKLLLLLPSSSHEDMADVSLAIVPMPPIPTWRLILHHILCRSPPGLHHSLVGIHLFLQGAKETSSHDKIVPSPHCESILLKNIPSFSYSCCCCLQEVEKCPFHCFSGVTTKTRISPIGILLQCCAFWVVSWHRSNSSRHSRVRSVGLWVTHWKAKETGSPTIC